MSILIKGMEMPKRGMVVNIYADGRVTDHFDEFGRTIGTAAPVPPHGDLVDQDEMFVEFVVEGQKTTRYKVGEKWELNGEEIRRVIQRLPAVIPAEETPKEDKE